MHETCIVRSCGICACVLIYPHVMDIVIMPCAWCYGTAMSLLVWIMNCASCTASSYTNSDITLFIYLLAPNIYCTMSNTCFEDIYMILYGAGRRTSLFYSAYIVS